MIMRLVRRLGFGRNPLRRRVDRIQFAAGIAAALLILAALPLALSLGHDADQAGLTEGARESGSRTPVTAVLLADAPVSQDGADLVTPVLTPARWRAANGSERTGQVLAWPGAQAGAAQQTWIDAAGDVVSAPLTPQQAHWRGMLTSALALGALGAALAVLLGILHWALNRRRYALWDREWRQFGPQWTKYRA
jgi:hypothetical protein